MSQRTITVRGSAKVSAPPDWVVISFDVISQNYEHGKCMEKLSKQTESLQKELASVGLEKVSLKTTQFSIDTHFDWVKDTRVFKGYKASHEVRVEFPFEKDYLSKVLGVLSCTQSKASYRISFQVKDPEPFRQQAIAGAVKNAKDKAQVLAEAAGVALGEIRQIEYSWSEIHFKSNVRFNEIQDSALESSFDITPEDVGVSDSVTVIYAID